MLRGFIKHADGRITTEMTPETIAASWSDPKSILWLDMQDPSKEEYELLRTVFHFHELAIEDSIKASQRAKIEDYSHADEQCPHGYYYMVFHGPDLEAFRENLRTKEIDIFVSDQFLITIHQERLRTVERMFERGKADPMRVIGQGIDVLLYNILDALVDAYQPILDYLEEALDRLEDRAVTHPKPELLQKIAIKKRELMNLRRVVGPQREVVAQLARGDIGFVRSEVRPYFRDVQDHLIRTVEMIELYRDLVMGARDIYMSSVSNNLNQIMKTLTTISVIGLPMSIVTSFFGMNFDEPIFKSHKVFIGALIFMACVVAGMLYLFKKKRWI